MTLGFQDNMKNKRPFKIHGGLQIKTPLNSSIQSHNNQFFILRPPFIGIDNHLLPFQEVCRMDANHHILSVLLISPHPAPHISKKLFLLSTISQPLMASTINISQPPMMPLRTFKIV